MVDLTVKPYNLTEEDVAWVKETIEAMTDEEKVGQLFFQLLASQEEDYIEELMQKYHIGGCRYNNIPAAQVKEQNNKIQKYAKIPPFIACNTEMGGNGACTDGTYIGAAIKIGATGKEEYARELGRLSNLEAASIGCNMAFAPVCDMLENWQNTEVVMRSFGNDVQRVAKMSVAYMEGAHTIEGFACAAKHFPGNGRDFRDAHISNNVNDMTRDEWMETYGKIYGELFDGGLDAIMGGHIMMPNMTKDHMPATLSYEIMTEFLRKTLGFNGMVVTDASHMVAMTNRMPRKEMLPASINAGCDMFLFFNDPDEDYRIMLDAYKNGVISKERMNEALTRILGLKAKMGLHKKHKTICAEKEQSESTAKQISRDALTLVKNMDQVLPLNLSRYKRIMIVPIKGASSPMEMFFAMAMGEGGKKKTPAEELRDRLIEQGFDAFIYVSPLETMKEAIAKGEKPSLNLYFAGKHAISDFVKQQDLVITLFDVMNGRPSFGMSKGGGEIPWYVHELPVIGISVNAPTMLADVPQLRTYINAYDSKPHTMDALVEALMCGESAFRGKDPIDSFCGMFDTRL